MTERDIDGLIAALREAVVSKNEDVIGDVAVALLGGTLKNLARIADACEEIAKGKTRT